MKRADANSKVFISDMGLAATLYTFGFQLVGLERANSKRFDFVFAATDGIEKVIADYWQDKDLYLPIQTLFRNLHYLKSRLYSLKCN